MSAESLFIVPRPPIEQMIGEIIPGAAGRSGQILSVHPVTRLGRTVRCSSGGWPGLRQRLRTVFEFTEHLPAAAAAMIDSSRGLREYCRQTIRSLVLRESGLTAGKNAREAG
jgi:hypothetical protein